MMGAVGGFFIPHFPVSQAFTTPSAVGSIDCGIQLLTNGFLQTVKGPTGGTSSVNVPGQWCTPQGGILSPGSFFEAQFSLNSGTIDFGALFLDGSWYALSIFNPLLGIRRTGVGTRTASFTVLIRNRTTHVVVAGSAIEVDIL